MLDFRSFDQASHVADPRASHKPEESSQMHDQSEKVRENRLRRAAHRQGLVLRKSHRRDPRAHDYGQFWLVQPDGNWIVAGGQFGMSLDQVEDSLAS